MKGSRFSEEQIIGILREHEAGKRRRLIYVGASGSRMRLFTKGKRNTAGWRSRRRGG
jgi:hypothetical protein